MRTYRSISYDKLYRWMQTECRTMSRPDGMMEVREVTKKAIQALKQDDPFFRCATRNKDITNLSR